MIVAVGFGVCVVVAVGILVLVASGVIVLVGVLVGVSVDCNEVGVMPGAVFAHPQRKRGIKSNEKMSLCIGFS